MRISTPARLAGLVGPVVAAAALVAAAPAAARAGEDVFAVASIKPVHSLVAAVMEGIAAPALVVAGGASPHTHALRPSEARMLGRARVIFWIGEDLETFLAAPLAALRTGARIVPLVEAAGVTRLALRTGGVRRAPSFRVVPGNAWREPTAPHRPKPSSVDPHVWLDPANASAMVAAIVDALSAADPANGVRYAANAARVTARIEALDAELRALLAPVSDVPYVVFHDAYQYFERRYGLKAVAAVTVSPERAPGARRLSEIRDVIRATGVRCVFTEPQFERALVGTVTAGTGAAAAPLDPLGGDIAPGPGFYFALMRALAQSLHGCLSKGLPG
jgi:zinc transport system substrate-binding protein